MTDFKVCLPAGMHVVKRLTANICVFFPGRFWIFFLVRRHVTYKVRVFRGVNRQSRLGLILYLVSSQFDYTRVVDRLTDEMPDV